MNRAGILQDTGNRKDTLQDIKKNLIAIAHTLEFDPCLWLCG